VGSVRGDFDLTPGGDRTHNLCSGANDLLGDLAASCCFVASIGLLGAVIDTHEQAGDFKE
jgi:hypothetical protein